MFITDIYFEASKLLIDNIYLSLPIMEMQYMQCIANIMYNYWKCTVPNVTSHFSSLVPWQQNFWIATTGSSSNVVTTTRMAKKQQVCCKKQNFTCAAHFFDISQPVMHDWHMKLPNLTSLLYGVGEHITKSFFCSS